MHTSPHDTHDLEDSCGVIFNDMCVFVLIFFFQKNLIDLLEVSADRIKMSERYELMGEIYKIAIPLYELERNFPVSFFKVFKVCKQIVDFSGRFLISGC